ncbi:MAG: cytochrome c [Chitinophagales bacterium]|nr:cytochrome c [Bacteroidota bacterium]
MKMGISKYLKTAAIIFALPLVFTSCKKAGGNYTGDSYTWDMSYSRAYETYSMMPEMPNGMSAITPVAGTVPYVGNPIAGTHKDSLTMALNLPYNLPNTPEGYARAALEVKNPFTINDKEVVAQGKYYFDIYCAVCHGTAGDGKGYIVTEGKYTAIPPNYFDPMYMAMTEGTMFHSVTYGRNAMQSYAYALSKEERWKVVTYVKYLQAEYAAAQAPTAANDTTKTN